VLAFQVSGAVLASLCVSGFLGLTVSGRSLFGLCGVVLLGGRGNGVVGLWCLVVLGSLLGCMSVFGVVEVGLVLCAIEG